MFSSAAVLALAHAFDDALLLPGPGVPLTRHAIALAIAVVATVAADRQVRVDAARASAPRPRSRSACSRPSTAAATRTTSSTRARPPTTSPACWRSPPASCSSALAAWIPFRHRGEGTASPVKRWAIRVAVLPLGLLAAMFFYMPVGMAIVDIHSLHRAVGNPPSADYETVQLTTSDGLTSTPGTTRRATARPC